MSEYNYKDLEKRIDLCVNDLKTLLQTKKSLKTKTGKSLTEQESNNKELIQKTIETISELLEQESSDQYFECFFQLILSFREHIILSRPSTSSDGSSKVSNAENSSLLTLYNVSLNSIWETVCFQIEKLIIKDMIKNNMENKMDCERICSQLKFLLQIKGDQGLDLWCLFNSVRVCKLETNLLNYNNNEFGETLSDFLSIIWFDCKVYKCSYFGTFNIGYEEITNPYIQAIKTRFEYEISLINGDLSKLIKLIKIMRDFDEKVTDIKNKFPRYMKSAEHDDMFDWKNMIETNGGINFVHRAAYNEISARLRELTCFNDCSYTECVSNHNNVLNCIQYIFDYLENYQELTVLDSVYSHISYILSLNLNDFLSSHFKSGKCDTILEIYTLLNTIYFSKQKLMKFNVKVDRFVELCDKLTKLLITKHVTILLLNSQNSQYWFLYLKRLWTEVVFKLKYHENSTLIFMSVLSETMCHYSRMNLELEESLFILNSIDDLMFKYCSSRDMFLSNDSYNIFNSCWLILIKLTIKSNPDIKLESIMKHSSDSECNVKAVSHWIEYIKPQLTEHTFWFNAKLCVTYENSFKPLSTVRALLCHNCGLALYILCDVYNDDDCYSIETAVHMFQIMLLYKAKPYSLANLLLSVIKSWSDFDQSCVANTTGMWWYSAIQILIEPIAHKYLECHLISLFNQLRIATLIPNNVLNIYQSNDLTFKDKNILLNESFYLLLTTINDIIISLPTTLIASLQYLTKFLPQSVSVISNSITITVTLSCIIKQLKNPSFLSSDNLHINFCKDIVNNLIHKLLEANTTANTYFKETLLTISKKTYEIEILNTSEEQEFEIILASILDDKSTLDCLKQLYSLIKKYEDVINNNLYKYDRNVEKNSETNDLDFNVLTEHKIIRNTITNQNEINFKEVEQQILSRLHNNSISSIIEQEFGERRRQT